MHFGATSMSTYCPTTTAPRVVIGIALYLVAAVGIMARLKFDSYEESSTWVGALVGGIVGGGIAIAAVKLHQQRAKRREAAEELL